MIRTLRAESNATGRFDHLIIGAGLYGAVMARELSDRGSRVLVIEKCDHVAGSCFTEKRDGIVIHKYGPHIFHTDNEEVWHYVNRFAEFRPFVNRPAAVYKGESYSLPFNMKTFRKMWGVSGPEEARRIIAEQAEAALPGITEARNLEEQAIMMAGTDIYEKLIKSYSEKQWGRSCRELPASFIRRVPVRFDYNDIYYDDKYQGIPADGYTPMIQRMLEGIEVITGADYNDPAIRERLSGLADKVICSGPVDAYYGYSLGRLEYRSLSFEEERIEGTEYYQDRAVINHTGPDVPYTRVTEHKHFDPERGSASDGHTIITREYPQPHTADNEALYPLTDEKNLKLYEAYRALAQKDKDVHFGGRLGSFRYYDMDEVTASALADSAMLAEA